jgi:outer membrane lipoprotein-sorting protein
MKNRSFSMTNIRMRLAALSILAALVSAPSLHAETAASLRGRLAAASAPIRDLKGTMIVHPANRSDARQIDKGIIDFLDQGFREANVYYLSPDKYRAQGKAKGIDVTFVINGNRQLITAPSLMLKHTENIADKPARKQSTLDLGFASDSLWRDNNVKVVKSTGGMIAIRIIPKGSQDNRYDAVVLDASTLKILRRERFDGAGKLKSRNIYANHKFFGKLPVATEVKVYASDGGLAGTIDFKNITVNTKLSSALFAMK